jgi:hypothetical protein
LLIKAPYTISTSSPLACQDRRRQKWLYIVGNLKRTESALGLEPIVVAVVVVVVIVVITTM